jgi:RNA polymerase sigma-70 factor (ECF subfamily)
MPITIACYRAISGFDLLVGSTCMNSEAPTNIVAERAERAKTDAELMERVARDDREAFSELYDRFARPLYATALRIVNNATEAEDIVQDVFLALWERASDFDVRRGTAFAWAVTQTRNRAIDRVRTRTRRAEIITQATEQDVGLGPSGTGQDSVGKLLSKEHASVLRQALAALPPDQRQAVDLAFFSGMTQQEISTRLSEPIGTVKSRIRRGLFKLRDMLGGRHD